MVNEKIYAVIYVLLEILDNFLVYKCLLRVSVLEIKTKESVK